MWEWSLDIFFIYPLVLLFIGFPFYRYISNYERRGIFWYFKTLIKIFSLQWPEIKRIFRMLHICSYENDSYWNKKKNHPNWDSLNVAWDSAKSRDKGEKYLPNINCWVERVSKIQEYVCHPSVEISGQSVNFNLSKSSTIGIVPKWVPFSSRPIKVNFRYNVKSMSRKIYPGHIACICQLTMWDMKIT